MRRSERVLGLDEWDEDGRGIHEFINHECSNICVTPTRCRVIHLSLSIHSSFIFLLPHLPLPFFPLFAAHYPQTPPPPSSTPAPALSPHWVMWGDSGGFSRRCLRSEYRLQEHAEARADDAAQIRTAQIDR